jgi:hypothetical protein
MCHLKGIAKETVFGRLIILRKEIWETRSPRRLSPPQDLVGAIISVITMLFGNYLPLLLDHGTVFFLVVSHCT